MEKEGIPKEAQILAAESKTAMLGSNSEEGYPNIKAMFKMENEGLKVIWFSTNTSSRRVAHFKKDPKACVYFVDSENGKGLMLLGSVEVLQDSRSKQRLWRKDFEKYYQLGVTDPDYTVLRFTAQSGNYYHALRNVTFDV
ncbi:MAG: pyridoxamine 5'-phosphate oxidase family protein [Proteobacteria bacterium]|nr:pyridoxamine 5'-phosphate oxidase family protein [Pseudomonadota bacterium]